MNQKDLANTQLIFQKKIDKGANEEKVVREERGRTSEVLRIRDPGGCGTSLKWSLCVTQKAGSGVMAYSLQRKPGQSARGREETGYFRCYDNRCSEFGKVGVISAVQMR